VLVCLNFWEQQQTQTQHLIRRVRVCSACIFESLGAAADTDPSPDQKGEGLQCLSLGVHNSGSVHGHKS